MIICIPNSSIKLPLLEALHLEVSIKRNFAHLFCPFILPEILPFTIVKPHDQFVSICACKCYTIVNREAPPFFFTEPENFENLRTVPFSQK